jgi:hypothetical protein
MGIVGAPENAAAIGFSERLEIGRPARAALTVGGLT